MTPAVTANGLPRVSRYASPAQLDWMLARYSEVSQAPATAAELREAACLGWERAVFDLESGRRYPILLRMSSDATTLANIWQDLPTLAQRHPRPIACAGPEATAPAPVSAADGSGTAAGASSITATGTATGTTPAADAAAAKTDNPLPPGPGSGLAGAAAAEVARVEGSPKSEAAVAVPARTEAPAKSDSRSAPAAVAPAALESPIVRQRRLLSRLRAALGMAIEPSAPGGSDAVAGSTLRPELPAGLRPELKYDLSDAALADLTELAQSDVAAIRLRARFHLLGLCTLAVEAADRYLIDSAPEPLGLQKACGALARGSGKTANLRSGQRRLLWSLLATWRIKYSDPLEPMSDMVIALASFAARDNPVVDGPRGSR